MTDAQQIKPSSDGVLRFPGKRRLGFTQLGHKPTLWLMPDPFTNLVTDTRWRLTVNTAPAKKRLCLESQAPAAQYAPGTSEWVLGLLWVEIILRFHGRPS